MFQDIDIIVKKKSRELWESKKSMCICLTRSKASTFNDVLFVSSKAICRTAYVESVVVSVVLVVWRRTGLLSVQSRTSGHFATSAEDGSTRHIVRPRFSFDFLPHGGRHFKRHFALKRGFPSEIDFSRAIAPAADRGCRSSPRLSSSIMRTDQSPEKMRQAGDISMMKHLSMFQHTIFVIIFTVSLRGFCRFWF